MVIAIARFSYVRVYTCIKPLGKLSFAKRAKEMREKKSRDEKELGKKGLVNAIANPLIIPSFSLHSCGFFASCVN